MSKSTTTFFNRHKIVIMSVLTLVILLASQAIIRAEDRRVVTLFVDGQEMIIPTTAGTVGELLDRAEIDVFSNDLVEPSVDSEITTDSFNVNVYRARPVTVVDGDNKFKVLSPFQSPELIAQNAGLTVYDEDEYTLERIDNILLEGAIGLRMTINRSTPITLNLYGESYEVRTQAETIDEFLVEKDISVADGETVRPARGTQLASNQQVFVLAVGLDVVTEEAAIPFEVEEIRDSAKDIGVREVQEAGTAGRKSVTYEVTLENGVEVSRKKLSEVVLQNPKKEVVVVGTKARTVANITGTKEQWMRAAGIPESQWWAVDSIVSRESGWNPCAYNPGQSNCNLTADQVNATQGGGVACGLGQSLPCGKWGADWTDPVAQLKAQHAYVNARYGGYAGAVAFWEVNHWY